MVGDDDDGDDDNDGGDVGGGRASKGWAARERKLDWTRREKRVKGVVLVL